jgi:DNA-binding transcriptional regulator YdaS (Cro superfamily)
MMMTERDAGIVLAIQAVGGVRALARAVGVSHVSVVRWHLIPVRHLIKIEQITGIDRAKLRPDIFISYNSRNRERVKQFTKR